MSSTARSRTEHVRGLRYVSDASPGITRRRAGRGFVYVRPGGRRVRDAREIARFRAIAIPPAWTEVWICPHSNGHILATGRDAKGRKQYRYHPRWRKVRDGAKFERLVTFGETLPTLRRTVREDLKGDGLPKERVVATIVALLDSCFARIGNEEYARENGSFGLTTLRSQHARFDRSGVRLRYRGKAGKQHEAVVDDPRIVRIVRKCQELPGQDLFQYVDGAGDPCSIGSSDVNEYLRAVTGNEFSAKDFRTWAGTVTAAARLCRAARPRSGSARQRVVIEAINEVAECLGNTRAVCRASYVHPDVVEGFLDGSLHEAWVRPRRAGGRGLSADERFVLSFLRGRAKAAARAARSSRSSRAA